MLPPIGLESNQLDSIQKKLVEISAQVQPTVNYVVESAVFKGRNILVIWIPGGDNRPYKSPTALGKESIKQGRRYYVRKGSVTCIADAEDERRLLALTNKIPFDDRLCHQADIEELDRLYIEDFLKRTGSKIKHEDVAATPMKELGWNMQIIGGVPEDLHPKNVRLLLFSKNPEKYFPYSRIEIVHFLDEVGDRFEEKILHGPIHLQLESALQYIKDQVLVEKVMKVKGDAKAVRRFNYPYAALEEIVSNAVFHKSWDDRNPIEIRINHDSIEVLNFEGPMPPITCDDLKKQKIVCRNYRNRRIGDFLKELNLTEGRSTGFPKIYKAVKLNDSPLPKFETDERNSYFLATLPIHPSFIDEKVYLASIGKISDNELPSIDPKNDPKDDPKQLSERQRVILDILASDCTLTSQKISQKEPVTQRTIKSDLADLQRRGILSREGGRRSGYWIITL